MIAASCSMILISNQEINVYFHHSWYVYQAYFASFCIKHDTSRDFYEDNYYKFDYRFFFHQSTAFNTRKQLLSLFNITTLKVYCGSTSTKTYNHSTENIITAVNKEPVFWLIHNKTCFNPLFVFILMPVYLLQIYYFC